MQILIVDDDPISRKIIAKGLRKAGYDTVEAANGQEGIDLLRENESIGLVIADVVMPRMGGLEMLDHLRKSGTERRIPMIICTALGTPETVMRAVQLEAAGYFVKPFDTGNLREKVDEILDRSKPENGKQRLPSQQSALGEKGEILKRLDLDPDIYLDLLDDLVERLSVGVKEVDDLLGKQDLGQIMTSLTALCGAAQSLGADRVSSVLMRQLKGLESGNVKVVQALIPRTESEIQDLRSAISNLRNNGPVAGNENSPEGAGKPEAGEA